MHTWHWRTWRGSSYLTCSLLDPWPHGFFTQQFWPLSPSELVAALRPDAEVYRVKQVHGNVVLTPSEILRAASRGIRINTEAFLEADGLITEQVDQAVWVASADCTPVLLADVETGRVAAVHAGWRGTAAKIVPQAIARLQTAGSRLQDLRIAMGPAIAGEVYQVSTQVAADVGASIVPSHSDEAKAIVDKLHLLPDSPVSVDPNPERVRLDVRRVNALQMEMLGISSEQVAVAPHCTYQEPERFFSYRREKLKKVQWSGIVSLNKELKYDRMIV